MKNKALEILIVEDNANHLIDVRNRMQKRIDAGIPLKVDYATNLSEALVHLRDKKYDGVISDVFYPAGNNESENRERVFEVLREACVELGKFDTSWRTDLTQNSPLGVIVGETGKEKGIPMVFCSDSYHHGKKSEPVNRYAREKGISFIDSGNVEAAPTKSWDAAFVELLRIRARTGFGQLSEGCIYEIVQEGSFKDDVPRYVDHIKPYLLKEEQDLFEKSKQKPNSTPSSRSASW